MELLTTKVIRFLRTIQDFVVIIDQIGSMLNSSQIERARALKSMS